MAWTAPTVRTTGELITASIWNTDLVADLLYLKARTDAGTVGLPACLGGSQSQSEVGIAVRSGATLDKLLVESRPYAWTSTVSGLTAKFSAVLKIESAGATATLIIVNLTDGAPDTAVETVTSTSTTGELKTSAAFTPTSGKTYGVKLHSAHASLQAWAWGVTLYHAD